MNILFKNGIDIANCLEEKNPSRRSRMILAGVICRRLEFVFAWSRIRMILLEL